MNKHSRILDGQISGSFRTNVPIRGYKPVYCSCGNGYSGLVKYIADITIPSNSLIFRPLTYASISSHVEGYYVPSNRLRTDIYKVNKITPYIEINKDKIFPNKGYKKYDKCEPVECKDDWTLRSNELEKGDDFIAEALFTDEHNETPTGFTFFTNIKNALKNEY
jgi:hypothetical protein